MKIKPGSIISFLVFGVIAVVFFYNVFEDVSGSKQNTGSKYISEDSTQEILKGWPPGIESVERESSENMLKKNYYIIFDASGSMQGDKIITAKKALLEFVKHVPEDANLGLAVFDATGLSERNRLGGNRNDLVDLISRVRAEGGTPLRSALQLAYDKINIQAARQLGYGEYSIIVVTDGEASQGEEPDKIVNRILAESPVSIHTIGFKIGTNHSLNQPGKILYKQANNLMELSAGLEEVLAELEDFSVTDYKEQD